MPLTGLLIIYTNRISHGPTVDVVPTDLHTRILRVWGLALLCFVASTVIVVVIASPAPKSYELLLL